MFGKMRNKIFILLLFLTVSAWVSAQRELKSEFDTYVLLSEDSTYRQFDYPVETIVYNGHEFEARAMITYKYDEKKREYERLFLRIFLKPDNVDGLGQAAKDSIAKYATANTLVHHERFYKKDYSQSVIGEADVYARAFSPLTCGENDKVKLKYHAVFDPRHTEECTIKYEISTGQWAPPSPVMFTQLTNWKFNSFWEFRLHNIGLFDKNLVETDYKRHDSYIWALMQFFDEINSEDGVYSSADPRVECPDTIYAESRFSILGYNKDGLSGSNLVSSLWTDNDRWVNRLALCTDGSGTVIMQNTYPISGDAMGGELLPFFANRRTVYMDYRTSAKCRYHYTEWEKGQWDRQLMIEQASFTVMFHQ